VHTGFWWENLRDTDLCEDLGIGGRMTLKWFLEKWNGEHGLD
jgi:hypothetical protein